MSTKERSLPAPPHLYNHPQILSPHHAKIQHRAYFDKPDTQYSPMWHVDGTVERNTSARRSMHTPRPPTPCMMIPVGVGPGSGTGGSLAGDSGLCSQQSSLGSSARGNICGGPERMEDNYGGVDHVYEKPN